MLVESAGLPVEVEAPGVDERAIEGSPQDLAPRLAAEKALAVSCRRPARIVVGADQETAVVASVTGGGRGGGAAINISAPLRVAHAVGAQISGSGVTVATALTKAHPSGAQVAGSVPTPGAPNKY